jgi:hypothetical protein
LEVEAANFHQPMFSNVQNGCCADFAGLLVAREARGGFGLQNSET